MLTLKNIQVGKKFKTESGIIWIIDSMDNGLVRTSMENGTKGNYRDTIEDVVSFLNEQKAIEI